MTKLVTNYSIAQHLDHGVQAERDSMDWQDSLDRFATDGERMAYRAGFQAAWRESRACIVLHANLSMRDSVRDIFKAGV